MKHLNYLLALFFVTAFALSASGQKSVNSFKVDIKPIIDGQVDSIYKTATDSATIFMQMEPNKGKLASEKTVAYIVYDTITIYVAVICFQDPKSIVAKIQSRDELSKDDDIVALFLDTYNDKRTGFGFLVNPLGTQIDIGIGDDGRSIDTNWDTEWESAVKTYNWGWVAEFAIPFSSVKYNWRLSTWGFNISRIIRYNTETVYWSGVVNQDFRMSQGGLLAGLELPKKGWRVSLFPYGTVRYEDSDFTGVDGKILGDIGGDIKIQPTSNLTANLTINPDFATVEADAERINMSRYELNYPEKRLFFQEGNDMFKTRIRTFYSRRIGDIAYGGKFTGKAGAYNMNILGVRSLKISEADYQQPPAFYTAARVKRDFLKSSTIGMTFVDKTTDTSFARSISADYVLNLGETWKLTGQYVGSAPGDWLPNSAWFVRFARENNVYHYHIRYSDIGENFQENVNQTGYIVDDDRRELDSDLDYKYWLQNKTFKFIDFRSNFNIFWSHKGELRSWSVFGLVNLYFQNRINFEVFYNDDFKLFEKKYYNHKYGVEVGYNTDEWSMAKLNYWGGYNFDRDFHLFKGTARTKITEKLALEYSFNRIWYEPDTANASTFINIFSVYYNFTKDLWIKVFAQNNLAIDRIYFYGTFGWRFKPPFGAVYLIYTRDEMTIPEEFGYQKGNILYLKLTYPIVIW